MTIASSNHVRRIVVAGDGFEGWLVATTLAQHLDARHVDITVCAVAAADVWDSLYVLLPANPEDLLHQLGISDKELAQRFDASFSLGARYTGIPSPQPYLPYGTTGIDHNGTSFHHHWRRVTGAGGYFDYSTAVRAMARDVFAPPRPQNAIGTLQHEYARHVLPARLTDRLRETATRLGVTQTLSPFASVDLSPDGKRIERLLAASGEKIEGDLFIDCTGPQRAVLSTVSSIDWIVAPGIDSFELQISTATAATPSPWHDVSASQSGWRVRVPTGSQSIEITLYAGGSNAEPGNLSCPWDGNCVAIGHAAASTLPLTTLHAHMLMISIGRLISLLPGPDMLPGETREYNQLFLRDMAEIHDYLATLEMARTSRSLRPCAAHNSLRRRLELFAKRGWIPKTDSDVIAAHEWAGLLLFVGLEPTSYDRLAEMVPLDVLAPSLRDLSEQIDKIVGEFPTLPDYLAAARQVR